MDRWVHLFFFHLTPVTGIRRGVVGRVCQPSRYMECVWSSTAGSRLLSVGMSPLPSAVPVSVYGRPARVAWRNAALPWMSGVQTGWQVEHLRTIVSCSNAFQEPLWHPCTYSLSLWLLLTNQLFPRCSRSGLKVAIKILIWVRKEDPSGNSAENHMHWEKNDCRVAKYIISEPRLKKKISEEMKGFPSIYDWWISVTCCTANVRFQFLSLVPVLVLSHPDCFWALVSLMFNIILIFFLQIWLSGYNI